MSTVTTASPAYRSPPGRLHAILLAGSVPLFLGALLSDIAYYQSYQIQWANFASWLIAGGLFFAIRPCVSWSSASISAGRDSARPSPAADTD